MNLDSLKFGKWFNPLCLAGLCAAFGTGKLYMDFTAMKTDRETEAKILEFGLQQAKNNGIRNEIFLTAGTKRNQKLLFIRIPSGYYWIYRTETLKDPFKELPPQKYRYGNPEMLRSLPCLQDGALEIGKTWRVKSNGGKQYAVKITDILLNEPKIKPDSQQMASALEDLASPYTTFILCYNGEQIPPKQEKLTLVSVS